MIHPKFVLPFVFLVLILAFQNCGEGFVAERVDLAIAYHRNTKIDSMPTV